MGFKVFFLIFFIHSIDSNFLEVECSDLNSAKNCDPQDFESSNWQEIAQAADISEQCLKVTTEVFLRRFSADLIYISNADSASFNVLKYFGQLITILQFNFYDYDDCKSTRTGNLLEYHRLLQLANENCRKSVISITIGKNPCGINMFDELKGPFEKAENVQINQPTVLIDTNNLRFNEMFPIVQKLDLELESINNPESIDCEFHSLNELTIGGGLMTDKAYDGIFETLIKKNTNIKRIMVKNPSYRTFQILHKYLKSLEEVHIEGQYQNDQQHGQLFFPKVKKLEINLHLNCHQPAELTFGGEDLQDLSLYCNQFYIDNEYFDTLNRYSNIKVLNANYKLKDKDLSKMVGKFPFLTKASFTFSNDITSNTVVKFVEKCNDLVEMIFMSYELQRPEEIEGELQTNIGGRFTIVMKKYDHSTYFLLRSNATKHVISGAAIFLISIHIIRAFFL